AHWLAINDAGRDTLDVDRVLARDRSLVVNWLPERIHDATDYGIAYRHSHNLSRATHLAALFDLRVLTHEHRAHLVFFQVHGDSSYAVAEVDQFSGHYFVQAVDASDPVAERDHRANFVDGDLGFIILDLLANELCNFVCFDLCHFSKLLKKMSNRLDCSRRELSVRGLACCQLLFHALQLSAYRAIVDRTSDSHHDAAH